MALFHNFYWQKFTNVHCWHGQLSTEIVWNRIKTKCLETTKMFGTFMRTFLSFFLTISWISMSIEHTTIIISNATPIVVFNLSGTYFPLSPWFTSVYTQGSSWSRLCQCLVFTQFKTLQVAQVWLSEKIFLPGSFNLCPNTWQISLRTHQLFSTWRSLCFQVEIWRLLVKQCVQPWRRTRKNFFFSALGTRLNLFRICSHLKTCMDTQVKSKIFPHSIFSVIYTNCLHAPPGFCSSFAVWEEQQNSLGPIVLDKQRAVTNNSKRLKVVLIWSLCFHPSRTVNKPTAPTTPILKPQIHQPECFLCQLFDTYIIDPTSHRDYASQCFTNKHTVAPPLHARKNPRRFAKISSTEDI